MNKRTPRKLICVVLALVLTLSLLPMSAFAAGEVAIDETNFPDANFRQYVLDNCDTNKNKALSDEEIANVTEIDVSGSGIASLKGVEYFTALGSLECSNNLITTLDLSKNLELVMLNCVGNHISTLDFSNNRKLISLGCGKNNLSSLNIQNCEILQYLDCGGNPLTSLDVSHNSKLLDLSVEDCDFTTLDTSHNPQLDSLRTDGNPLTSIDVSHNSVLRFLCAAGCQLTKLDLGMHYFLELLDISENQLTSLDLSNNPYLVVFSGQANSYTVNKHKDFDYTTLPGKFDVTKVSNVKGGKFDTAKHTFSFDDGVKEATYDYATGNSNAPTASFKLVYSGADTPVTPSKNPFTDVPADQYYYEPVLWAVNKGITAGVSEDKFGPNDPCTRGQIVTFLWAAAGRPEPTSTKNPFRDVSSKDYFYKAVLWAVENKITAGVAPDRFGPNETCTRAQTVTFLWASQGRPAASTKVQFTDVSAKDYFADSVAWAYENGVTAGVGGGRFGSGNNCARAHCVTFLYKAVH